MRNIEGWYVALANSRRYSTEWKNVECSSRSEFQDNPCLFLPDQSSLEHCIQESQQRELAASEGGKDDGEGGLEIQNAKT